MRKKINPNGVEFNSIPKEIVEELERKIKKKEQKSRLWNGQDKVPAYQVRTGIQSL